MSSDLPQDLIVYLRGRPELSPVQKKTLQELALDSRERPLKAGDMARRYVKRSLKAGNF